MCETGTIEHFYEQIPGWFTYPRLYRRAVANSAEDGRLVEVGSWMGKSISFLAVEAVNSGASQRIIAVDSWGDHAAVTSDEVFEGEETYRRYLQNIGPVADKVETMRLSSLDAAKQFADRSCDFVFIDASHEFEDVLDDLRAWYPKVRSGGVFAGHDYHWPGVSRAVREFASERNLKRPRSTELCWVIEVGEDSRSRRQRFADTARAPLENIFSLVARVRYEVHVRGRNRSSEGG